MPNQAQSEAGWLGYITADVRYSTVSPQAKVLFAELTACLDARGTTNASKTALAGRLSCTARRVAILLQELEQAGFVAVEQATDQDGKEARLLRPLLSSGGGAVENHSIQTSTPTPKKNLQKKGSPPTIASANPMTAKITPFVAGRAHKLIFEWNRLATRCRLAEADASSPVLFKQVCRRVAEQPEPAFWRDLFRKVEVAPRLHGAEWLDLGWTVRSPEAPGKLRAMAIMWAASKPANMLKNNEIGRQLADRATAQPKLDLRTRRSHESAECRVQTLPAKSRSPLRGWRRSAM